MEENNILSQEKETLIPEPKKEESEDKLKDEYIKAQINLSKNLKKEGDEYLKSNQFPKSNKQIYKGSNNSIRFKKEEIINKIKEKRIRKRNINSLKFKHGLYRYKK